MDKVTIAEQLVKVAKLLVSSNGELIATNNSFWSWEYDSSDIEARLYVKDNGDLYLEIEFHKSSTGINQRDRRGFHFQGNVGTLKKPKLAKIRSLLKQYGHEKSRAGRGFKRNWMNANNQEASIKDILEDVRVEGLFDGGESKEDKLNTISKKLESLSPEELDMVLNYLR